MQQFINEKIVSDFSNCLIHSTSIIALHNVIIIVCNDGVTSIVAYRSWIQIASKHIRKKIDFVLRSLKDLLVLGELFA